jgi:hypothetical protein
VTRDDVADGPVERGGIQRAVQGDDNLCVKRRELRLEPPAARLLRRQLKSFDDCV